MGTRAQELIRGSRDLPGLRRSVLFDQARRHLSHFVRLFWAVIEPSTPLLWGWHHDAICDHLEAVTRGEIRRLVINIPPRSLKSTLIAVMWPAWAWISRPHLRWLTGSYDKDLATRDAVRSRRIMQTTLYRAMAARCVPNGQLPWTFTTDQNTKERYENSLTGYRITTSPGSKATGEGGDIVFVDDPNDVKKAESETERDSVNGWLTGTMSSRVNPTSKVKAFVIIQQRTHEDDASGHLLQKRGWQHLCVTQEFEPEHPTPSSTVLRFTDPRTLPGELLQPEVLNAEDVDQAKEDLGSHRYAGQHQQRPGKEGGTIFTPGEWPRWTELPHDFDYVIGSWDFNLKRTDKEEIEELDERKSADVGWLLGVKAEKNEEGHNVDHVYLISERRNQWEHPEKCAQVRAQRKEWKGLTEQLIEDKAGGPAVMETLVDEISGLVAVDPGTRSKVQRAYLIQGTTEAGRVHLPHESMFPWVKDAVKEIQAFPFGKFDDRVDVLTQALLYIRANGASSLSRRLRALSKTGEIQRFRI